MAVEAPVPLGNDVQGGKAPSWSQGKEQHLSVSDCGVKHVVALDKLLHRHSPRQQPGAPPVLVGSEDGNVVSPSTPVSAASSSGSSAASHSSPGPAAVEGCTCQPHNTTCAFVETPGALKEQGGQHGVSKDEEQARVQEKAKAPLSHHHYSFLRRGGAAGHAGVATQQGSEAEAEGEESRARRGGLGSRALDPLKRVVCQCGWHVCDACHLGFVFPFPSASTAIHAPWTPSPSPSASASHSVPK